MAEVIAGEVRMSVRSTMPTPTTCPSPPASAASPSPSRQAPGSASLGRPTAPSAARAPSRSASAATTARTQRRPPARWRGTFQASTSHMRPPERVRIVACDARIPDSEGRDSSERWNWDVSLDMTVVVENG